MTTLEDIDAMLFDGPSAGDVVSAAELADWFGITAARINAMAREGRIPRRPDGTFDLKPAVRAYCETLRQRMGKSALALNPELNAEKIRLAREQADKTALQNAKARGELIATDVVARTWAETVTDLRAALLAVPSRVAGRAGLDRRATALLDAELRAAMTAISEDSHDS